MANSTCRRSAIERGPFGRFAKGPLILAWPTVRPMGVMPGKDTLLPVLMRSRVNVRSAELGVLSSLGWRQRLAAANEGGALLCHHQHTGIDLSRDEIRHRRNITDAQAFDAVYFEIGIQNAVLIDRAGAGG